jgi:hypothetical protein
MKDNSIDLDTIDTIADVHLLENIQRGLGEMCMKFQDLEGVIRYVISSVVTPDNKRLGDIVTNKLSFKNLTMTAEALYSELYSENREIVLSFHSHIQKATYMESKRNQLIHSSWNQYSTKSNFVLRRKLNINNKQLKEHMEEVTIDQISSFCEEMEALTRNLITFIEYPFHRQILKGLEK